MYDVKTKNWESHDVLIGVRGQQDGQQRCIQLDGEEIGAVMNFAKCDTSFFSLFVQCAFTCATSTKICPFCQMMQFFTNFDP